MKRLVLAFLSLCSFAASAAPASADFVAEYAITQTGVSRSYFTFGYTPPGGSFTSLVGYRITGASLSIDYLPAADEDINNLRIEMDVPVTGARSQFFGVAGSDMIETAPGLFHYDLTTDDYNGVVNMNRFEVNTYSLVDGGATGTAGRYLAGSGFRYTIAPAAVTVPEPASAALLVAAGGVLLLRRPWRAGAGVRCGLNTQDESGRRLDR